MANNISNFLITGVFLLFSCGMPLQSSNAQTNYSNIEHTYDFLRGGIFEDSVSGTQVSFEYEPEWSVLNTIRFGRQLYWKTKLSVTEPFSFSFENLILNQSLPQTFEISWGMNISTDSIYSFDKRLELKRTGCIPSTCFGYRWYQVELQAGRCQIYGEGIKNRSCE